MKWSKAFILFWAAFMLTGVSQSAEFDYLLGDGDVIKVSVYDNPDLTTVTQVDSAGNIHFPFAGQVNINGLTTTQAAEKITESLSGDYLVNPQVSVFIQEYRSKNVVISGQVVKPGLYELRGQTTLFEMISMAGGLKKEAGLNVTIHRAPTADNPNGEIVSVNLKALLEDSVNAVDVYLKHGDSITVPASGVVFVSGEVRNPAAYRLERDTTVMMAITNAGGFSELASKRKVRIVRKVDGKEVVMKNVSMNELVQPDDIIIVPESFF